MRSIWEDFVAGKITTKEAFDRITVAMGTATGPETDQLVKLAEKILDKDMPMSEKNLAMDEAWWKATHKED